MNKIYLFDSSAIIEILKDNKELVSKYKDSPLITINLAYGEIYYYFLKNGLDIKNFKEIKMEIINYNLEDIEAAMEFLLKRKKEIKDFSFIDSMVYTIAIKNNFSLVTKDYGFLGLKNVEIIKS